MFGKIWEKTSNLQNFSCYYTCLSWCVCDYCLILNEDQLEEKSKPNARPLLSMCRDFPMTALAVDSMKASPNVSTATPFRVIPWYRKSFCVNLPNLKNNWKMMLNRDVDEYTKSQDHRKTKKNLHVLKTKPKLGQGCSTFLLLPAALHLFIWSRAVNESSYIYEIRSNEE